jgi:peroxidase
LYALFTFEKYIFYLNCLKPFQILIVERHFSSFKIRRSVTGAELPSARTVSVAVLRDPGDKKVVDADSKGSHLLMQWGQFLDHDLTATPQSHGFNGSVPQCCKPDHSGELLPNQRHPECYPIPVDPSDPHYSKRGVRCLHFVRSAPAPRDDCSFGARQQANAVTAFLDGSTIYGSWEDRQLELRLFHHGNLKIFCKFHNLFGISQFLSLIL